MLLVRQVIVTVALSASVYNGVGAAEHLAEQEEVLVGVTVANNQLLLLLLLE